MNKTIQTIIEMDKGARERVRRAKEEADRISAETEKKLGNLMHNSEAQSEAEIKKACEEIKQISDKEIAKITAETDEKCRRLDSVMENRADDMCREIIDRIFRGAE